MTKSSYPHVGKSVETALDIALVLGLAIRLTKFVTEDDLGRWWIRDPAMRWAGKHESEVISQQVEKTKARHGKNSTYIIGEGEAQREVDVIEFVMNDYDIENPWSWQAKLVSGLGCRWCVGLWLSGAAVASWMVSRRGSQMHLIWRFLAGTATTNVTGNAIGGKVGVLS